jgi:ribulose-phosphate 3-epimerase
MMKIAPSILSADFARLYEEIETVKAAEYLHFDVMDGVFVPNISIGLPVLESVRRATDMALDVHLMITQPSLYVRRFAAAGADIVTFHVEADSPENISRSLLEIHDAGKRAGLALKPQTPIESLLPYLDALDMAVVMTVEPGFGGQKFQTEQMTKVTRLREEITRRGLKCEIEIDGGVNPETAVICARSGADVLVVGSDMFGAPDRAARIAQLKSAASNQIQTDSEGAGI